MELTTVGDLVQGGALLTFAFVVWTETRMIRRAIEVIQTRIALIEERQRTQMDAVGLRRDNTPLPIVTNNDSVRI